VGSRPGRWPVAFSATQISTDDANFGNASNKAAQVLASSVYLIVLISRTFILKIVVMPKFILIVDDNALVRKALRVMFERQPGWRVCGEAESGSDAIEKAIQLDPDLITLDLAMPGMNGLDAARELKQLMPTVPVLIYTNYKTLQLEQQAMAAGADGVVSKSEPSTALLGRIQTLFSPTH
jgi:CheY-like chemotaxis protein